MKSYAQIRIDDSPILSEHVTNVKERMMKLLRNKAADEAYAEQPTMTLGQLRDAISLAIARHGEGCEVRVDTTYDQGQRYMAITRVESKDEGYVAIEA